MHMLHKIVRIAEMHCTRMWQHLDRTEARCGNSLQQAAIRVDVSTYASCKSKATAEMHLVQRLCRNWQSAYMMQCAATSSRAAVARSQLHAAVESHCLAKFSGDRCPTS